MNIKEFGELKISCRYPSCRFSDSKYEVSRELYCKKEFTETVGDCIQFKYKEIIKFIKDKKDNGKYPKAICIGYNPAKASKDIDETNKRLIKCLWETYDEYLLVNLFPQVSSDKTTCIPDLKENVEFCNVIIDILKNDDRDVILFWGRTVSISEELFNAINNRIDNELPLKMTTYGGRFIHPGAIGKVELNDVTKGNLKKNTTYKIE